MDRSSPIRRLALAFILGLSGCSESTGIKEKSAEISLRCTTDMVQPYMGSSYIINTDADGSSISFEPAKNKQWTAELLDAKIKNSEYSYAFLVKYGEDAKAAIQSELTFKIDRYTGAFSIEEKMMFMSGRIEGLQSTGTCNAIERKI